MPFKPGSIGRPVGARSVLALRVEAIAQRVGVDPFEVLCLFAKGDHKTLGCDVVTTDQRLQAATAAAKYLYSQKRSVEHSQTNVLDGMTPEQKLEAAKNAVRLLELQLKDNGSHDT